MPMAYPKVRFLVDEDNQQEQEQAFLLNRVPTAVAGKCTASRSRTAIGYSRHTRASAPSATKLPASRLSAVKSKNDTHLAVDAYGGSSNNRRTERDIRKTSTVDCPLGIKLAQEGALRRHASQQGIQLSPVSVKSAPPTAAQYRSTTATADGSHLSRAARVALPACKLQVLGSGANCGGQPAGTWQSRDRPSPRYMELSGAFRLSEQRSAKLRKLQDSNRMSPESHALQIRGPRLRAEGQKTKMHPQWIARKAGGSSIEKAEPTTESVVERKIREFCGDKEVGDSQPLLSEIARQRSGVPASAQWSRAAQGTLAAAFTVTPLTTARALAADGDLAVENLSDEDYPCPEEVDNFQKWCSKVAQTATSQWKCTHWLMGIVSPSCAVKLDDPDSVNSRDS